MSIFFGLRMPLPQPEKRVCSLPVGSGFMRGRLEPAHAGCYDILRGIRREPDHFFSERERQFVPVFRRLEPAHAGCCVFFAWGK